MLVVIIPAVIDDAVEIETIGRVINAIQTQAIALAIQCAAVAVNGVFDGAMREGGTQRKLLGKLVISA